MSGLLPPLRFTGAQILRDGRLQQRSIAIAEGRITKGPLSAIDLSGFLILPGVIDMLAQGGARPWPPTPARARLDLLDRAAASQGITTQYLAQGWSWEREEDSPGAAEALAQCWQEEAGRFGTDLRLMLRVEHESALETARLIAFVQRFGVKLVCFSNQTQTARELDLRHPDQFAALARAQGRDPEALRLTLDGLAVTAAGVPRALCQLAERFDQLGVLYGSIGDRSAEAREHHSMIGAGLCFTPASRRVAAAARAVSDPLLLSAPDILEQIRTNTLSKTDALACEALVSDGQAGSLVEAALALDARGFMPFERAWSLISERPARLLRLTDRGRLDLGARADLTLLNRATGQVEATIVGGRLAYLAQEAGARFLSGLAAPGPAMAAE